MYVCSLALFYELSYTYDSFLIISTWIEISDLLSQNCSLWNHSTYRIDMSSQCSGQTLGSHLSPPISLQPRFHVFSKSGWVYLRQNSPHHPHRYFVHHILTGLLWQSFLLYHLFLAMQPQWPFKNQNQIMLCHCPVPCNGLPSFLE